MNQKKEKELKLLEKAAGEYARKELLPEREVHDTYPFGNLFNDAIQKAFDLGFFHIMLPEEMDGLGREIAPFCRLLSSLCQTDAGMGAVLFTNSLAQEIILSAGATDLLQTYISEADQASNFLIATQPFLNPSDTQPQIQVTPCDGKFLLSGMIEYLALGNMTGKGLVAGNLADGDAYSFFLIDLNNGGVSKSAPIVSMGLHACPVVDVELNVVPGELVGQAGDGPQLFSQAAGRMSAATAAMACGVVKGAFGVARSYCRKRQQGGKVIARYSEVRMILADMAYKLDIAETLVNHACRAADANMSGWDQNCRAAALYAQQMACAVTSDGIQMLGGYGYVKDFGQEKYFRDAQQINALLGMAPMRKLQYLETYYRLS